MRQQRQNEFADAFIQAGEGILYLCPRFGKTRTAINIFKKMKYKKILISYPDNKIKESWQSEMKEVSYKGDITYTTHLSLHKYKNEEYDIVVIDEIHLLSEKQIENVSELMKENKILGLTGTLSSFTEKTLQKELGLKIVAKYSIEQAIEEGVVCDYEIIVKMVPLDDTVLNQYKSAQRTEKRQFDAYGKVIEKMEKEGKETFFLRLSRMRIIQNSLSKIEKTKELLDKYKKERVLVFCGLTSIADRLGCPVYHSKKGDKELFEDFAEGKGNHLAVVKIGNTGVTYKPLDRVIINYFDSNSENLAQKINRCMAMEYGKNKIAKIHIICSTEEVEKGWLRKALEFFDKEKIIYEI